jgi:hypothetical protein
MKYIKNKGKKEAKVTLQPRSFEEIQAAYGQLCAQAGAAQYQVYVHSEELKRLNESLVSVNQEAAARQRLDAEAKAKEATQQTEEKKEV